MTSGTTFSAISRWWTRYSVACGITATRWPSTVLRCANCRAELMDGPPIDQRDYVRRLLEAYRATPGTSGAVHGADRLLAAQLHERGVPLEAVENAFVLAATRRMIRSAGAVPLGTIAPIPYPENELPPPTPRAFGANDIAAYPRRNGRTPAAWMMTPGSQSCSRGGSLQSSATGSLLGSSEAKITRRR